MLLGVLFSFLASVCFGLSNLMEKRAVDNMTDISANHTVHMLRQLCSSWMWISGFLVGVVAVGFTVLGYTLIPIAIVQTIFGAGLVLVVLAARLYLREPMVRREYLGLCVIIIAVILISVTLGTATVPGVRGASFSVLAVSTATLFAAVLMFGVLRRYQFGDASLRFGATSGLLYGIAALQIKGAAVLLWHQGLLKGILSVLASPYPYLFVVMSVLGLLIFQSGLQRCRIAMIVPITNVVASVYVVVVGMFVFDETFPRNTAFTVLRLLGFALVLGGNWVFATGPATSLASIGIDDVA